VIFVSKSDRIAVYNIYLELLFVFLLLLDLDKFSNVEEKTAQHIEYIALITSISEEACYFERDWSVLYKWLEF
jgi:hypothetical protein